jgi:hypothetical protein
VRSNPGCQVLYSTEDGPYQDVTPDICCSHITPPPPPPPTPVVHKKAPRKFSARTLYIPGIYTNYWQFKDTLGALWYFGTDFLGFISVMELTTCPIYYQGHMILDCGSIALKSAFSSDVVHDDSLQMDLPIFLPQKEQVPPVLY